MSAIMEVNESNKAISGQPDELSGENLSRPCDSAALGFSSTDELPALKDVIGQPRAFRALELGSEVQGIGYNIFVLGIPDSGRTTLTRDYLQRKAVRGPIPDDWIYVNNFEDSHRPHGFPLPAGRAVEFRKEMQMLVAEYRLNIPRVFASEEYTRERDRLVNETKQKLEREFRQLEEHVSRFRFVLIKTPYGLLLGPAVSGKPISPHEFEQLSEEHREKLKRIQEKLSGDLEKTLGRMREIEQATAEEIRDLDIRTALFVIRPLIDQIKEKYVDYKAVRTYLEQVQKDMVSNVRLFHDEDQGKNPVQQREWSTRYDVNVLVDNTELKCAPVITENQPTYHNLLGTIEHDLMMGVSYTDFTKIRAGALHRANGGYLILPARDVLMNPYAWEGLKRVLRDREIRIMELGSQMGLISTASLEPEPIPLDMKVILVGTPILYYLLRAYDEDFAKLFKVRAEFTTEMERTLQSEKEYALFVKSVVEDNHLAPFDRTAVARIIEHSARMVEDQEKLSTQFGIIADLICEADYWAKKIGQEVVCAEAVEKAITDRIYRSNRIEERIQEMIQQGMLILDVRGRAVGQVNALSVISLGDYAFGRPSRLTASVCAGQSGVTDIERQAKLGGPIHTKGVLIIGGFLGLRYGQNFPLSLTASLTFEQSYDEVEGDSASAAELLALLSAIASIPIDQGKAVTGSINQHGQIQAIGGVNEKIEGFYAVCQQKGLTGEQGVIIPEANRRSLMLKAEVIAAVEAGAFHIWPVRTIDEAIILLTGVAAGERCSDGSYMEGSFNHAVMVRLNQYHQAMKPETHDGRQRSKINAIDLENQV
jgi:lon-related putative ATP-dependent protease